MSVFAIKHRSTGAVLWSGEAVSLRDAVTKALAVDASLAGANLAGASLAGASLVDANLDGANLDGASLDGASLDGATNVPASVATGAPATDAPPRAHYVWRRLTRQERAQAARERHPDVPIVPNLDTRILEAIEGGQYTLEMSNWHGPENDWCGTTHCRAGMSIHVAGARGWALERKLDPLRAGRLIYLVSTGRSPHFFASNEAALADIRRCAAEEAGDRLTPQTMQRGNE